MVEKESGQGKEERERRAAGGSGSGKEEEGEGDDRIRKGRRLGRRRESVNRGLDWVRVRRWWPVGLGQGAVEALGWVGESSGGAHGSGVVEWWRGFAVSRVGHVLGAMAKS